MAENENLDADVEVKSGSSLPLIVGAVVIVGAAAAFFLMSGTNLSPEEEKQFEDAKAALRTDDYKEYEKGTKLLESLIQKHPKWVTGVTWAAQTYLAWGDALTAEAETIGKASAAKQQAYESINAERKSVFRTVEALKKKNKTTFKKTLPDGKEVEVKGDEELARLEAELKKTKDQLFELQRAEKLKSEQAKAAKDKGVEWAKKAERLEVADPSARRVLADYFRILEAWDKSEKELELVSKLNPDSAGLRFIRGMIHKDKDKDCGKAIPLFEEALQKDPKFNRARYFAAICYDKTGNKAKADELMKAVLDQAPEHTAAKAYFNLTDIVAEAKAAAAAAAAAEGAAKTAESEEGTEGAEGGAEGEKKDEGGK